MNILFKALICIIKCNGRPDTYLINESASFVVFPICHQYILIVRSAMISYSFILNEYILTDLPAVTDDAISIIFKFILHKLIV